MSSLQPANGCLNGVCNQALAYVLAYPYVHKTTMRYDGEIGREPHGYPPQAQLPL